MDFADSIAARLDAGVGRALTEIGEAWAEAAADDAPAVTGTLSASVHYEQTGPTTGHLVMRGYGRSVATAPAPTGGSPRQIASRARYARKIGRAVDHPNDFPARAWDDARVRALRDAYPGLVMREE